MLKLICRATGMGFAAVARVTSDRWIACRVQDEINFGLKDAGELKVETTICNLIRDSKKEVVFDDISNEDNEVYRQVASLYGFSSYISYPIVLNDGAVFGTLCAIDPRAAHVTNHTVRAMFGLLAKWIALRYQKINPTSDFVNSVETILETVAHESSAEAAPVIRELISEIKTLLHAQVA